MLLRSKKARQFVTNVLMMTAMLAVAGMWMSRATPAAAQQVPGVERTRPEKARNKRFGGRKKGPRKGRKKAISRPAPPPDDNTGFTAIFDGKTLNGWDGDPAFWRVEDGAIVGQSTEENPVQQNTFVIWQGGEPGDFELKLEYRIDSTNSGIQYRSVNLPDVGKWVLKGYQADIDAENRHTGQLYEERGRGFLATRGQFTRIVGDRNVRMVGSLGDAEALKSHIKADDWNHFHVIALGNVRIHVLNGHVMCAVIDDDAENRRSEGLLGFQMHRGAPMKVEFRNIMLKEL